MHYTRVIIIGGGFGGINCANVLRKSKMDITIVDRTNHHLFQPLLYQTATAALSPSDIAMPIREIVHRNKNTYVMMANVVSINKERKTITLENKDELSYDYLVIATGARHSYFGKEEWEPFAPGLKTIKDALNIRERILVSFEKAERCDSYKEAAKYLTFVVVGGGPTGVEMAGAIAEIAHQTMLKNFRRIDTTKTQIFLVESHPHVLPVYPPSLGRKAQADLEKLGVKIINNRRVTNITKEGVYVGEDFIETRNVIWAAGTQASPLLKTLDTELDRAGRAIVQEDCSIPGYPDVFVIGDAASFHLKDGSTVPGVSPAAVQQGRYVGNLIKKQIPKEKRKPFVYFDKGSMATIGKYKAVAKVGPVKMKGIIAWFLWCFVHVFYLVGFRHKFIVIAEWVFLFIKGKRNVRLINNPLKDDVTHKTSTLAKGESMPEIIPKKENPIEKPHGDQTKQPEN